MGNNVALVLTFVAFYILVKIHQWWMARHSPTGNPPGVDGVKPQVGAGVTPGDPTSGGPAGEGKTILRRSSVDSWLAQHASGRRTNELIRDGARRFGVSVSTIKRRLRKLRENAPK